MKLIHYPLFDLICCCVALSVACQGDTNDKIVHETASQLASRGIKVERALKHPDHDFDLPVRLFCVLAAGNKVESG